MTLNSILDKAKNSSFYLFLLNIVLRRIIPYNAPHRFKVEKVNEESLEVSHSFHQEKQKPYQWYSRLRFSDVMRIH